jgi:hypothetical protein
MSSSHLIAAGSLVAALAAAAAWYAMGPANQAKPDTASQPAKPQRPLLISCTLPSERRR